MSGKLTILAFAIAAVAGISTAVDSGAGQPRAVKVAALADSFSFRFAEDWGTEIDTRRRILTKDLIIDSDSTVPFTISAVDLDSVYRRMIRVRFFEMPEPHPPWPECNWSMSPSTNIHLEATLGAKTRRLSWSTESIECVQRVEGDWRGLRELEALIWRIILRQPVYRALPEPRGGYL